MKKIIILSVLFMLLPTQRGECQLYSLFHNTFVSFDAGASAYFHGGAITPGAGINAGFGKWLLTTAGLRGELSGIFTLGDQSKLYAYGHLDYLFDPVTSLLGRNPKASIRPYMVVGLGLVACSTSDKDFFGTAGLGADWRVGTDWRLFGEMKFLLHPAAFDNNTEPSSQMLVSAGLLRDIEYNPTRSRSHYETQCFENDIFFRVAFGVNSFNYNGAGSISDRLSLMTPIFEFGMGKRLNPIWLIRLSAQGLYARSAEETFSYYSIRGDLVMDLNGLISLDRVFSPISLRPYIGTGIISRLDDQSHFIYAPSAGMQFVYHPSPRNEIALEASYTIMPPRFANVSTEQSTLSVGMASLMVSYNYMFTRNSFR